MLMCLIEIAIEQNAITTTFSGTCITKNAKSGRTNNMTGFWHFSKNVLADNHISYLEKFNFIAR